MKRFMNKKGQGTTEYIVILGIVVAIAVAVVWTNLKDKLKGGIDNIGTNITNATRPQ